MRPRSPTIYNTGHKSRSKYPENCIGGGGFHSPVTVTASKEALIFPTGSINQGRASTKAGHQPRPLWYGRGPFPKKEEGLAGASAPHAAQGQAGPASAPDAQEP